MKFISTRGDAPVLSFEEVVLAGLANDGGLYVPETLPTFSRIEIASWAGLSYQQLAFKVIHPFIDGEISDKDLIAIIDKAYDSFSHDAIAPLIQTGHNEWVLELFRGPTLAFKDFALQFLGHLLDYILEKRQQRVVVMGATSGDTGSAETTQPSQDRRPAQSDKSLTRKSADKMDKTRRASCRPHAPAD